MTTMMPSLCYACKHLTPGSWQPSGQRTCAAYPQGIPWEYMGGGASHIDPEPDGSDGGIVFEVGNEAYARPLIESFVAFWDSPLEEPSDGGPSKPLSD
jgi:hypothetical protein